MRTGRYGGNARVRADLHAGRSRLITQATGQPTVAITATSDSTFAVKGIAASLTFHREANGAVTSLTLHQNGERLARGGGGRPWPGPTWPNPPAGLRRAGYGV